MSRPRWTSDGWILCRYVFDDSDTSDEGWMLSLEPWHWLVGFAVGYQERKARQCYGCGGCLSDPPRQVVRDESGWADAADLCHGTGKIGADMRRCCVTVRLPMVALVYLGRWSGTL